MTNDVINYESANVEEVVICREWYETLYDEWEALHAGRIDLQLSLYGGQVRISLYDLYTTGKITEECFGEIINDYLVHVYEEWDGDLRTMHRIKF